MAAGILNLGNLICGEVLANLKRFGEKALKPGRGYPAERNLGGIGAERRVLVGSVSNAYQCRIPSWPLKALIT